MPKINVYLPDDLAAAVRAAGIPVSLVCQQALAKVVRSVNDARKAISMIRDPGFDPRAHPGIHTRIRGRMTAKLSEAYQLAHEVGDGHTGTAHLLTGVLDQGDNLGLGLLRSLDIDPDEVRPAMARAEIEQDEAAQGEGLTRSAWLALAAAAEYSISFGHNYLGCEHLVLGLVSETDGVAGRALRGLGAEPAAARKSAASMLAGFAYGRQTGTQLGAETLSEILRRLQALESRVASIGSS